MNFEGVRGILVRRAVDVGHSEWAKQLLTVESGARLKKEWRAYQDFLAEMEKEEKVAADYVPHQKQEGFHWLGRQVRERLFLAGNRCGKTLCGSAEMAYHLTGNYPEGWMGARFEHSIQAWAASVTVGATRDILQRLYLGEGVSGRGGLIPRNAIVKQTLKAGVAHAVDEVWVRHASGGDSCLGFKSYDMGRAKFQGTARHVVHLDEEPPLDIYE